MSMPLRILLSDVWFLQSADSTRITDYLRVLYKAKILEDACIGYTYCHEAMQYKSLMIEHVLTYYVLHWKAWSEKAKTVPFTKFVCLLT